MSNIDLRERAYQAMLDAGFIPDIPNQVCLEVDTLNFDAINKQVPDVQDLRKLKWSSIDNVESRDLDQLEYAEELSNGDIRLLIAIADVDVYAPLGSITDHYAGKNTTSVYTGAATFPMLPERLSTEATSLLEGQDRLAMVVEMYIDTQGGVKTSKVFEAWVHNYAKLTYESVGDWLDDGSPIPPKLAQDAELKAQLELQVKASKRLRAIRQKCGALTFSTIEPKAVTQNGKVVDLKIAKQNLARDIIEAFMVATNIAVAEYIEGKGFYSLRRVVHLPKRWDRIREVAAQYRTELPLQADRKALADFLAKEKERDPARFFDLSLAIVKLLGAGEYVVERPGDGEGHFGLATGDYTHSTAPNRRYADLVTQRLLKAVVRNQKFPYSEMALSEVASRCTEREDAVRKIERLMRKVVAANFLEPRIGETFDAVVTGSTVKGTFVRLLKWPAEGRVVRRERGIDVGDKVSVRLISTDAWKGFIDFERI
jgi:VacB/RNase II family 3'-5' exoribonuclease